MYPIYLFNNKQKGNIGINASEFEKRFKEICEEHRDHSKAGIFAFILTDFQTMEANHFVLNNEFWNDLHTTSGHYLTIFHLDYKSNEVNKLFRKGKTEFVKQHFVSFFAALSKIFETAKFNNIKLPSMLFFQTNSDQILDFFCVELEAKNLQENMNDLKDYIETAMNAVSGVITDNLKNSKEIFDLVKRNVESTKSKKVWTARIKKAIRLYELIK
jgi:hypothetical protein